MQLLQTINHVYAFTIAEIICTSVLFEKTLVIILRTVYYKISLGHSGGKNVSRV